MKNKDIEPKNQQHPSPIKAQPGKCAEYHFPVAFFGSFFSTKKRTYKETKNNKTFNTTLC